MITFASLVYQPFHVSPTGLLCDDVSVDSIVARAGTPLYIYSARAVSEAYRAIDTAFASYPHAIHYAMKANSTLAIVRLLRSLGSRADANSGGEIQVAERAGFTPQEIVFTGVGKTREELEFAVGRGVGTINAESAGELDRIAEVARALGRTARVCASTRTSTRRAIRTSPPACAPTSSASRCRRRERSTAIAGRSAG